ncbi:hypothetical protein MSG28_015367 [Choristoneura fumiferana]|uniref:Uncharacterized protein n=1 Tax=Choristoneura fumiferana TaxID=7141 RepID=A0ACC0KAM6_CHOFU|nr:hypothetical protein MSG28_015367 [Choristoneura fumiferana]
MADRIRQIAQRLRDKVHLSQLNTQGREQVEKLITKYAPASKMSEIAEKIKHEAIGIKVKELVHRYEKFTGVEEIMAIQNTVIEAQERFVAAQNSRRELGRQLANIEERLKELHAEMQNTMKGDEKYLQLCTEEHKVKHKVILQRSFGRMNTDLLRKDAMKVDWGSVSEASTVDKQIDIFNSLLTKLYDVHAPVKPIKLIIQERSLRTHFADAEREERELFAQMSAAVKLGHERERAHAERNKYWYIVASIFGTVLGIAGSTINNRLKMAEFRDMMEQQMARSASVLYTVAGGGGASRADITEAMKTEFAYQEQLAQNLAQMQDNINHLVNKQASLIEHLNHQEHVIDTQMRDLKKLVVAASLTSAKSDAELTKALNVVHQDLDDDRDKEVIGNRVILEPHQVITGVAVIMCVAILFGSIVGRS